MRVLFVAHSSDLNGAELTMVDAIQGLPPSMTPVAVVPREGPLVEKLAAAGAHVHAVPAPWWLRWNGTAWPSRRHYLEDLPEYVGPLRDIIRRESIDVVYSSSSAILHAAVAAALSERPHLWHVQELLGRPGLSLVLPVGGAATVHRVISMLASCVVVPSHVVAEDFGRAARRLRVVYPGHHTVEFPDGPSPRRPEDASLHVGLIGTVGAQKGSRIVPAIVSRVAGEVDVQFYWAGKVSDGERSALENSTRVGGKSRLTLLGFQDDVRRVMGDFDIVLHASENESFGRVLVEAAAAGKPVVATRCGGSEEIVVHGETGLLAPVNDASALSDAILTLARDPALRARMGRAARQRSAMFSMERYREGMCSALEEAARIGPAVRSRAGLRLLAAAVNAPGRVSRALHGVGRQPSQDTR